MAYKIIGRVLQVGTPQSFTSKSGNPFVKRDVVIMVRKFDQYTGEPSFDEFNTPKFSFMNEKCQQLDQVKIGDVVTISFDLRGRTYDKDGKTEYINDLSPFSIIPEKPTPQLQQQSAYPQSQTIYRDSVYRAPVTPANAQPPQSYQQPLPPQTQQVYPQPPQQTYTGQPYTSSSYGQNAPTMPQNGRPGPDDDVPF